MYAFLLRFQNQVHFFPRPTEILAVKLDWVHFFPLPKVDRQAHGSENWTRSISLTLAIWGNPCSLDFLDQVHFSITKNGPAEILAV